MSPPFHLVTTRSLYGRYQIVHYLAAKRPIISPLFLSSSVFHSSPLPSAWARPQRPLLGTSSFPCLTRILLPRGGVLLSSGDVPPLAPHWPHTHTFLHSPLAAGLPSPRTLSASRLRVHPPVHLHFSSALCMEQTLFKTPTRGWKSGHYHSASMHVESSHTQFKGSPGVHLAREPYHPSFTLQMKALSLLN